MPFCLIVNWICPRGERKFVEILRENIMSKSFNYFDGLTWDKVSWTFSYKHVRRIQRRIFKASRSGDIYTVQFLQKLLLKNPHAKLIAVHQVTTFNKGKSTKGIDGYRATTSEAKLEMARNLCINGKANLVRKVWISKPGKTEKRPLGIPTIQDRAKQTLAKLALEPEWEAKFEANSYGFRPGRSAHDAIEAIFSNLRFNVNKYVFDADIRKCFDQIDHSALLTKLNTFLLMEKQISAWLKAGVFDELANEPKTSIPSSGTPQGGVISPLLANIALHGLEEHLMDFVSQRNFPKSHPGAATGRRAKRSALGFVRYADDFVIIHRNLNIMKLVIKETELWLAKIGLSISEEKFKLRLASQSFNFLGFQVICLKCQNSFRVCITPGKENISRIVVKVRGVIQNGKSYSAYSLIAKLRPILIGWANYFQFCECKKTFSYVDNIVYQQLRAWIFRRAIRQGRKVVKTKYFPTDRTYKFQNREYKANWILNGIKASKFKPVTNFLPKMSWVTSRKFVKVKAKASVYDGNEVYWTLRNPKYGIYSTRVKNLLTRQKGKCSICNCEFVTTDIMEVDHIIPLSKGGADQYKNLQLLHRQCHVNKTKVDLGRLS
jgi:RNA-directed DNA polymerase